MNYEILISISLGDNFPLHEEFLSKECKTFAILEAKFNDEILQSDPIELTTSNPELATELGFRLHKKDFQQFRIERKSIKLQCFVEYSTLPDRHFIGYVVLHLRDAQDYTHDPKYKWNVLLNPKYKGSATKRPQLYLALMVNKFTDGDVSIEGESLDNTNQTTENHFTRPIKKDVKLLAFSDDKCMTNSSDFDSNMKIKYEDKTFFVWDENFCVQSDCKRLFVINVLIDKPNNLLNLFGEDYNLDPESSFYFKYTLLGQQMKTNNFFDIKNYRDFKKHKFIFPVKTFDKKMLKTYFECYPTVEIQFVSQPNKLIGFVTLNILKLFNKANALIDGEYMIVPEDESVYVKEPLPVVNLNINVTDNMNEDLFAKGNLHLRSSKSLKAKPNLNKKLNDLSNINHYYIAIDLRTIKLITQETKILFQPFYLQFSYAFFGITDYIKTYPSIDFEPEQPNVPITIPHGFCGFNFATTPDKLQYTFSNIPLIVQLILEMDNTLLGTAEINLECLLDKYLEADKPNNDISENFINTVISVHDELNDQICEIQIVMFLQEIQNSDNNDEINLKIKNMYKNTSENNSEKRESLLNNLNGVIIETAHDIEIWKEEQMNLFKKKLKEMEKDFLENNQKSMDESLENKKLELNKLEKKLKSSLEKIETKEKQINEKESLLDARQKQMDDKFAKLGDEIEYAIQDIRAHYNEKCEKYSNKINVLEQEKHKNNEKIYQLERKLKEKDIKIKDLETQLIDVKQTQKSKIQQRATSLTRSVTSNPRRIIITRDCPDSMSRSMIDNKTLTSSRVPQMLPRTLSSKSIQRNSMLNKSETPLIDKIRKERQELIKRGVSLNDPMILEIDKQLKSYRLQNKSTVS